MNNGTVHPSVAQTLSFLKQLFTFPSALHVLFVEHGSEALETVQSFKRQARCFWVGNGWTPVGSI